MLLGLVCIEKPQSSLPRLSPPLAKTEAIRVIGLSAKRQMKRAKTMCKNKTKQQAKTYKIATKKCAAK